MGSWSACSRQGMMTIRISDLTIYEFCGNPPNRDKAAGGIFLVNFVSLGQC